MKRTVMGQNICKWLPDRANVYRKLRDDEIARLTTQFNTASNWGDVLVAEGFDAARVHRCTFDGYAHIGVFNRDDYTRYGNVTLKKGLYGSYFRNTVIGDNAAIHNLNYCCEQRIGDSVIIANVGEISSDTVALYGMGAAVELHKDRRNYQNTIDIINENGGRAILPCPGMTCTDAFIWAKFREDEELMLRLAEITNATNSALRPQKAIIADNVVILNTKAVRRTLIGPSTVIDGAEMISNATILSDPDEMTVIGMAVQIHDSIIGYGNRINSATQLSSVLTGTAASFSQSARITHSVIGDNAHIACCEIANCLIMPSHAQHHNNSFLIAAMVGGQSNIAAGATIGSNHNSRANDGEIWAGRGFWPGLCVSLKHNSRFASFTMISKGAYTKELDVRYPFSLVATDDKNGTAIFPAFWFNYNMYAVMRSAQKFVKRDRRTHRGQFIEHDILAPDTVEEMFEAVAAIEAKTPLGNIGADIRLNRADGACKMYRMMIRHYCAKNILPFMRDNGLKGVDGLLGAVGLSDGSVIVGDDGNRPVVSNTDTGGLANAEINKLPSARTTSNPNGEKWLNCGSMVITESALSGIIDTIKIGGNVKTWDDVHALFDSWTSRYNTEKLRHAVKSLAKLEGMSVSELSADMFEAFLRRVPEDCKTIGSLTLSSRSKDFSAATRTMVYDSKEEMSAVLGAVEDSVIKQTATDMDELSAISASLQKNNF